MKERDWRFDFLKALAIFCVVISHVIPETGMASGGADLVLTLIYGVNMPLFFVISGYFAKRTATDNSAMVNRSLTFLKTMFAFSLLLAFCMWSIGIYPTVALAAKRTVSIPLFGWWFMWSLIFSMAGLRAFVIFQKYLPRILWADIGLVCIFMSGIMLIPSSWWQVNYFKFCFPFYVGGYLACQYRALAHLRSNWCWFVWLLCACTYVLYCLFCDGYAMSFYKAKFDYCSIGQDYGIKYLFRYFVAFCGIVTLSVPIFKIRGRVRFLTRISEIGTTTLGVYLLHQDILKWIIAPSCREHSTTLIGVIVLSAGLSLFCHSVVRLIINIRFMRLFFF